VYLCANQDCGLAPPGLRSLQGGAPSKLPPRPPAQLLRQVGTFRPPGRVRPAGILCTASEVAQPRPLDGERRRHLLEGVFTRLCRGCGTVRPPRALQGPPFSNPCDPSPLLGGFEGAQLLGILAAVACGAVSTPLGRPPGPAVRKRASLAQFCSFLFSAFEVEGTCRRGEGSRGSTGRRASSVYDPRTCETPPWYLYSQLFTN